jgi:hypothetical protein
MTIKRNGEKVILKGGKVSCSCCGFCKYFDIDVLLYEAGFSGSGYTNPISASPDLTLDFNGESENDFDSDEDRPSGEYHRVAACWRFLCREVVVDENQVLTSEKNTQIGGPTTNDKDLWLDICKPLFGNETESGTFIYAIEFFGWKSRKTRNTPQVFVASDTAYGVIKYKIIKQT